METLDIIRPKMEAIITNNSCGVFTSSQRQHEFTKDYFLIRENHPKIG